MTAPTNTEFVSGTTITSNWLNGVNDHVNNLESGAHSANKISCTPSGSVTATNVQTAIDQLAAGGGGGYTLPPATELTLGGVKVGDNLTVTVDGKLSAVPGSYTLPAATTGSLGGVIVGSGLAVTGGGVLSSSYSLPTASSSTLGGVKVGTGLAISGSGVLSTTGGSGGTAADISYNQGAAGATTRTVQAKLQELVSIQDFGAVGDNATDNTTAFTNAVAYMKSTGRDVYIPPGIYLTDPVNIGSSGYAKQASFIGDDPERCVIKRRTTGSGSFITIGSVSATNFQAGVGFSKIKIDGGVSTNGSAFEGFDIVNSTFESVHFSGGANACLMNGGVEVTFRDCRFENAVNGLKLQSFASAAAGGYPNLITVSGGVAGVNSGFGIWFDAGQNLTLEYVDIEGNGTTLGTTTEGGVYVGPNVGIEVAAYTTTCLGVIIHNCWIEANKGFSQVQLNSGINAINHTNFFTGSFWSTHDIYVNGGTYSLNYSTLSFPKTYNLYETSSVGTGNVINYSAVPALQYDATKTTINYSNRITLRGGSVPTVAGVDLPLQQNGLDLGVAGATGTITFGTPFKTGTTPRVFATPTQGSYPGYIVQIDVFNVTNTSFDFSKKTFNGTTFATANLPMNWVAYGRS